ncbi:MgtC/SapB family protein [Streptomyces andamanensis]|uniref:MgtC/SapB family protein n=1 Tax=Streptomyces andamanensis TaxID=1565035 RepID=A0ABV8TPY5_9ACTN
MADLTTFDFALRLAVGGGCGALIGVERQWRARMAGLRTNALVAVGATLFVLYSEAVGDSGSPTRVASYVVSGIGFLGGGVILREGGGVRGLNTAATLWCSAAVGVLAASGRLDLCLIGTAVVIAVHLVCDRADETHVRALLLQGLTGDGLAPTGLRVGRGAGETTDLRAEVVLTGDPARSLEQLIARLSLVPGVRDLHWHLDDTPADTERGAAAV